jgi:xylose isomerase
MMMALGHTDGLGHTHHEADHVKTSTLSVLVSRDSNNVQPKKGWDQDAWITNRRILTLLCWTILWLALAAISSKNTVRA